MTLNEKHTDMTYRDIAKAISQRDEISFTDAMRICRYAQTQVNDMYARGKSTDEIKDYLTSEFSLEPDYFAIFYKNAKKHKSYNINNIDDFNALLTGQIDGTIDIKNDYPEIYDQIKDDPDVKVIFDNATGDVSRAFTESYNTLFD